MALPFGADLPLVLRALDAAQLAEPEAALRELGEPERARLDALGLLGARGLVPDLHARIGRALMYALTADPAARTIVAQARTEARAEGRSLTLALRFPRDAALLADLPWELLWDDSGPGGGLPLLLAQGGHSSCVRYLALPRPLPPPPPPAQQLCVLAVTPRAGIEPELYRRRQRSLEAALAPALAEGSVQLVQPAGRLTIAALLDLVAAHRPDVLSFFGHGLLLDGQGHLLLDAEYDGAEPVAAERLVGLADAGIRLVLLHACRSDQPGAGLLSGTAALLSALGVPAVIAMQTYVRIGAAARLQAVLCRGLAAGQSVQEALAWGRAVLYAEERDAASWYVPTLTIASPREKPVLLRTAAPDASEVGAVALAQAGVRHTAPALAAGTVTGDLVTAVAASSLLPFRTQDFGWATARPLLTALGGAGLAAWFERWAAANLPAARLDEAQERQALSALSVALAHELAQGSRLADDLAALIARSAAIPTALDGLTAAIPAALDGLAARADAQSGQLQDLEAELRAQSTLLRGLQTDLRRADRAQGRLSTVVLEALSTQTGRLIAGYEAGTTQLSAELGAALDELRALRDELRARDTLPAPGADVRNVGNDFTKATIGMVGSISAGDKYDGDRVEGAKNVFQGPVTINQAGQPGAPAADPNGFALTPDPGALLTEYLRRLSGECSRLSLADADSSDPNRAVVELDQVYTRLEVENTELEATHTLGLRLLSALEVLAEYPRLVLLGEPGSGKSTFINFVSLCFARMALGEPGWRERIRAEWPHGPHLPIRIELRAFATWLLGRPQLPARGDEHLCWLWLNQQHGRSLGHALRQTAANGRALLLFDGLDEVMHDEDGRLLAVVLGTIRSLQMVVGDSRMMVACRTLDYDQQPQRQLPGWTREYLIPFSDELRAEFISRWYEVLGRLGRVRSGESTELSAQLIREIRHRSDLRRLAGNPLLLTMMAILHTHERSLPEGRAMLYVRCVELLLHRWRAGSGEPLLRERLGLPNWSDSDLHRLLDRIGMAAHDLGVSLDGERGADLPRRVVVEAARVFFEPYGHTRDYERAQTFCNYVSRHSNGVLQQSGPDTYRFPHRTFQEYLAARRLIADDDWADDETEFYRRALRRLDAGPQWRDALLLAVSQQVTISNQASPGALLVEELLERNWPYTIRWAEDVILAGEILVEIGPERLARLPSRQARLREQTVLALTRLLRPRPDGSLLLEPAGRIRAGVVLGLLGDPRTGVCDLKPDWVAIPAGSCWIGSSERDPDAFGDERPQRMVALDAFSMARYPVTNAQWQRFIDEGGYADERWWSPPGLESLQREGRQRPHQWPNGHLDTLNCPVVGVTWYEATAYCAWLSAQLGTPVRLPSKHEWEKAARGPEGLIYPWGNEWQAGHCNVELQANAPIPVGIYPNGASPYGLLDMSGNVLEWTASPWSDSNFEEDSGKAEPNGLGDEAGVTVERRYVVRGGAWDLSARSARCAYQLWRRPFSHGKNLGLRVVTLW